MELVNCATWFEKTIHEHTVSKRNGDGRKIITKQFYKLCKYQIRKNATPFVEISSP